MELEFFCQPGSDLEWFDYWRSFCHNWLLSLEHAKDENLRCAITPRRSWPSIPRQPPTLSFCSPSAGASFGAWRTARITTSISTRRPPGQDLTYYDQEKNEHYIPYVIEPSLGADRVVLALLVDAYDEEVVGQDKKGADDVRTVLHLAPALAPYKCAILPLSKKEVLTGPAIELYNELSKEFMCDYDETGSIGKRYRRADEIGTPFCITFDFDTVGDEQNGPPPTTASPSASAIPWSRCACLFPDPPDRRKAQGKGPALFFCFRP
jgi:glycyl-tRNA synthetase